jgi:hypothetical protein
MWNRELDFNILPVKYKAQNVHLERSVSCCKDLTSENQYYSRKKKRVNE